MKLEGKDLCFLDIESTGLDTRNDRIVEISITKVKSDGTQEKRSKRFNPQIEISEGAFKKHGLTNEMLKDEQPFGKYAKGIMDFIGDSTIITYMGYRFDIQILFYEFERASLKWNYMNNKHIDCGQLWTIKEPRGLKDAFKYYTGEDAVESELHTADYDTELLMAIFKAQTKKYYGKVDTVTDMAVQSNYGKELVDIEGKFYRDSEGDIRYAFGKAKDEKIEDAKWQLEYIIKGAYSDNTKTLATFFLDSLNEE